MSDLTVSPGSKIAPRLFTFERHSSKSATACAACVVVARCDGPRYAAPLP